MQEKDFVAYEYKTKTVKAKDQSRTMDMYEAFGWEVTAVTPTAIDNVTFSLKRNRKQLHKQELTRLERQAEDTFAAIRKLEEAKTLAARIFSYIFGCVATLIFGGGMCLALLNESGNMSFLIGGIVLGIIGLALCGLNPVIFKKISEKKTKQVLPAIDDNEEKLANLLEKGDELLKTEII